MISTLVFNEPRSSSQSSKRDKKLKTKKIGLLLRRTNTLYDAHTTSNKRMSLLKIFQNHPRTRPQRSGVRTRAKQICRSCLCLYLEWCAFGSCHSHGANIFRPFHRRRKPAASKLRSGPSVPAYSSRSHHCRWASRQSSWLNTHPPFFKRTLVPSSPSSTLKNCVCGCMVMKSLSIKW